MNYQRNTGPKMTRLQSALQSYLRAHSGETITREQLCAAVWQMNYFRWSRTIDQTVSVVRKHLGEDEKIVTVFGVGYRHEQRRCQRKRLPLSIFGTSSGDRPTAASLFPPRS